MLAAAPWLTGCGGGNSHNGYPKSVEKNFVGACQQGTPSKHAFCQCVITQIESRLPFSQFEKLDAALTKRSTPDPRAGIAFSQAISKCHTKL